MKAFLCAVLASIVAAEVLSFGSKFGRTVVRLSARLIDADRRHRFEEEWLAHVDDRSDGGQHELTAFSWSLGAIAAAIRISGVAGRLERSLDPATVFAFAVLGMKIANFGDPPGLDRITYDSISAGVGVGFGSLVVTVVLHRAILYEQLHERFHVRPSLEEIALALPIARLILSKALKFGVPAFLGVALIDGVVNGVAVGASLGLAYAASLTVGVIGYSWVWARYLMN